MEFEWDAAKAEANRRKHGVDFEEAITVFADRLAATVDDPDHSEKEQRLLTVGYSIRGRLLFVYHVDRGDVVRVISARPATAREASKHENKN